MNRRLAQTVVRHETASPSGRYSGGGASRLPPSPGGSPHALLGRKNVPGLGSALAGLLCLCLGFASASAAVAGTPVPAASPDSAVTPIADTAAGKATGTAIVLPPLSIDAERASYQALISRPQDEITPEMIRHRPTRNPIQLLRSLNSGIVARDSLLGAVCSPDLRGFEKQHVKVLVDGCPTNGPWRHDSMLSAFPLRRLRKITVVPGGQALIYGTNVMAGAVNLTLPTARDLEGLTFLQEVGERGTHHQEFLYGKVAHHNEHLFGLFTDTVNEKRRYKTNGDGCLDSDNRMLIYRGRVETDSGWVFKATLLDNDGNLSVPNYRERFEPWRMSHHDFVVEKEFGDRRNLILRYATYKDFSSTQNYTGYDLATTKGAVDPANDAVVRMKTTEVLYNFPAGDKNSLTIGGQTQANQIQGMGVKEKVNEAWHETTGVFLSDSITPTDKINLHFVGRSDDSYGADRKTSWSTAGEYKITSRSSVGLGFSRTIRFPNVQEVYRFDKKRNVYGNEDLEPESAANREFRFSHQVTDDWKATVTCFSSDVDDQISLFKNAVATFTLSDGTIVPKGGSYFRNIDKAEIAGWECGVNGRFNDRFDGWLNYTRLEKADDAKNDLRLWAKPTFRLNGGVLYHQGRTSAMLAGEHQGRTPGTRDAAGNVYSAVDAATLFDLNLRYQLPSNCSVYLNVENLTDVDDAVMVQALDTAPVKPNFYLQDPLYYRTGRRLLVGLEMQF